MFIPKMKKYFRSREKRRVSFYLDTLPTLASILNLNNVDNINLLGSVQNANANARLIPES